MKSYTRRLLLALAILVPHLLIADAGRKDSDTGGTISTSPAKEEEESSVTSASRTEEFLLYRLTPLGTRNPGSPVQISEVTFFHEGEDILADRRTTSQNVPQVTGPASNSREEPQNLVDGDYGTKWLGPYHGAFVVFNMKVPTSIDSYMIWTANDFPRRDPLFWKLEGSNDGLAWTVLDSVWDYPTPEARFARFKESGEFPLPTGAMIHLFSIHHASHETPVSTFLVVEDGEPITLTWNTGATEEVEITPDVGPVEAGGSVTIIPPPDSTTTYTLSATGNDGLTRTASVRVESRTKMPHAYRYIRFDVFAEAALRDSFDALQLSRFLFFRNGAPVYPVNVTNPFGKNPSGEGPGNLLGSTDAKWLDGNLAHRNDSHLVFDFGEAVEIDAYQLGTANDFPQRDPLRWRLYGRNSINEGWTRIENMDNRFPVPMTRHSLTSVIPLAALPGDIRGFNDWREVHFSDLEREDPDISGPTATPASDGIPNLLKYAFGLPPKLPASSAALPHAEMTDTGLRMTYQKRTAATDIRYVPEKSFDLVSWDSRGILVSAQEPVDDGEFERITITINPGNQPAAFLRMRIVQEE